MSESDLHADDGRRRSGAPEAGGATTPHSMFGGGSLDAHLWRFIARVARAVEATAYRRLRDLEARRLAGRPPSQRPDPGAPNRVRRAN